MNIKVFENGKITNDEQIEVIKKVRGNSAKLDNTKIGEALLNEQWEKATEYAIQVIYDYLVSNNVNNFDAVLKQYRKQFGMGDVSDDDENKFAIV